MGRPLGLAIALIAGFWIFYLNAATPKPASLDAPTDEFSAARAMVDVRAIGSRPHPLGSPGDVAARDYLVGRMRTLGLSPRIEHGSSFEVQGGLISGGAVDNVVGVLPGRDRTAPALALMAHYDSVDGSPGAADDAAGVATALEMIRAIKTQGVPDRDIVVAATDGEEAGLLGARAFFEHSPFASQVGYVINMEARGGGGRATMFETAVNNGEDITLFRKTADRPQSNALTVFIYRIMSNETDFTIAKAHAKVGLNYAFIGRQFDYHSPSSTPDALDQGSLQHMGDEILPTAKALAFGPLPARAPDAVYGNVLGSLTAQYAAWGGWFVLLAAAVLIGIGAQRANERNDLAPADVARGAGASLYILFTGAALLELVRRATGDGAGLVTSRAILARFPLFEIAMFASALGGVLGAATLSSRARSRWIAAGAALIAGGGASLFGNLDIFGLAFGLAGGVVGAAAFGSPAKLPGSWTGVLLVTLITAVAAQAAAPTAAYILAWPLLAAAFATALSAAGAARRSLPQLAVMIIAALTLGWVGGLFHGFLQAIDLPFLPAFAAWLAGLVIWPLAVSDNPDRASLRAPAIWILVGVAVAALIHLTSPWSPRHPNAVEPVYVVDPADHKAWRASLLAPDAWSLQVLKAEGGVVGVLPPGAYAGDAAAPAAAVPAAPPAVTAVSDPDGRVTVTARPHAEASRLMVAFRSPSGVSDVEINGAPAAQEVARRDVALDAKTESAFSLPPNHWGKVVWAAPEGFTLTFRTTDPEKAQIQTAEVYDRWMAVKPLPPMPPTDQPWDLSGSSLVLGKAPVTRAPAGL